MAAKSGIIKDDNGNQFCPATKTNMIVDDDGNRLDAIIAGLVKNDGTRAYGTWDINIYGSAHYLDVKRQIWGQDFNATADIKNVMIKYATGIGYSTTRQIELSSGLVKVNDTLNAASASFSGNVTDAAIHYFANGTTYYVNASGAAKFNGTNAGALTATTGEFTSRVHTTNVIRGDAGVFSGGIGDLSEFGGSGYNDILPYPNESGNAVTYLEANGSTLYYHLGSFSLSTHNHNSLYQPLDSDLTAIAGLTGTSGFLKKTAANTWSLDTNTYLTTHQTIYGLTIQKNGTTIDTYTPNSAAKTINISDVASASSLSTLDANIDACIGSLAGLVLSLQAKNHFEDFYAEYANIRTISSDLFIGYLKGNADTALKLTTTRALTIGATAKNFDGSAAVSWSLAEIGIGNVENAAASGLYVPLTRTVAGIALGSNIATSSLQSALGLGSNAYSSTDYLPLTGGSLSGALRVQNYDVKLLPISSLSEITDGVLILCPAGASTNNNVIGSLYIERSTGTYGIEKIDFGYSTGGSTISYSTYIDVKNGVSSGDGVWTFVYFTYNSVQYIGLRRVGQAYWATTCTFAGHNLYTGTNSLIWVPTANGTVDDTLVLNVNTSISGNLSSPIFIEGGTSLSSKYLGLHATADKVVINNSFTGTYPLTVNVSGVLYSHNNITYNGTTGTLTAAIFAGALSGNASTATQLITGRTLKVNLASTSASTSFNGTADVSDIGVSGILPVANGGTGLNALTSGYALIGNGTGVVNLRAITDTQTLGYIVYNSNLITANTLAFWNGAYNSSGVSNISKLGTIELGVWHGTMIGTTYGGTGNTVFTQGKLIYAESATKLSSMSSTVGSTSVPIYLNAGAITACTSSQLFSGLSWDNGTDSGPALNITVTGQNRTSVIPSASASVSGIVTTGAQTFAGSKTFSSIIIGSINGNADTVDNLHASDFVRVTGSVTQTITGAKTFSASVSMLNSLSVASNINAGGIIRGDGGVFAGGIGDLGEEEWTTAALSNGTQGTTYGEVRYRKIGNNTQIDGSFVYTWDGTSTPIVFTLPTSCCPIHNMTGWLYNNSNGIWRYVIGTDGKVSLIVIKSIADGSNITSATTCIFNNMIFPLN